MRLAPPGIRIRAVPGLVAADYFAPGYFVWAVLIENLAKIGYEGKKCTWQLMIGDFLSKIYTEVWWFFPCLLLFTQSRSSSV